MIRWIVRSSMKFQYLVITIAAVLVVFGVTQLREMPVDVLPEFSPPFVEIQTEALGLSAKEVEQMITVPMEQDLLAGVAWLDVIRSESVPGLSSVLIYFEPGTDLYRARQMVTERLSQAAVGLPHVSKPPTMIQPLSSASRFMIVGLSSKDLSLIQMSVLARWVISPRLMGVPGVAHVAIWGQRERQLQVLVDPERLQSQDVSLEQVVNTTGNALWVSSLSYLEASSPGTGGFIDTPNQRLGVWHVLPISSPEELAQVPIEGSESLHLGDVTDVVEDHQLMIGDAIVQDNPNLLLVIEKLPEMNTLEVTRGIEAALDALRPGLANIEFDATLFRPASFIEMALANLTRSLIIAALLVVLILGIFLYDWRTALISLVIVTVSLIAALVVLYLRGATLNAMVLAGLVVALGVIVDDAIVDIEHIAQRLRQNFQEANPEPIEKVILEACVEMRGALFFATLLILLVALPVFFMEGVSGALFRQLAISYVMAVLAAMVAALTVTPALTVALLSKGWHTNKGSPFVSWMQQSYRRMLVQFVQKPRLIYAAMAILIITGLVALPFLGESQILPTFREPYLSIQLEGAPATSLPEMDRIVTRISNELQTIAGVQDVSAHVGRAVFGDQIVGINSAQLWVRIDPKADYDSTLATVQKSIDGYIGLKHEVTTYIQQTLDQPQLSKNQGITLRVFGEDLTVLQDQAERLEQTIAKVNGVVDSYVELPVQEPTLEIEVDLDVAQHYGLKPGDVRRQAATLLSGILVGSLFEEQKVFDVVVWGTPEIRQNLTDLSELKIDMPGGGQVPLGDVAKVQIVSSPTVIHREAASPYLDIKFDVQGRNASAVVRDIQSTLKGFVFPLEYHAEVMGDYATRQMTLQRILIAGIIALIGIFLLLQASSGSWRLASAAFLTMPAMLVGGLLAVVLSGGALPLTSLFGLVTVLAIGMRNSLMLINHYQRLELRDGEPFGSELILRGSVERIGPTLLTVLAMALTLLVFVFFGDIPGNEIVRPIAIVILSGLITSTLVNLFALPALYLRFGASREPDYELFAVPAVVETKS